MRIAVATVQVPFISGGAEVMTHGLLAALREAGHQTEVVTLPFRFSPASAVRSTMDAWEQQDFAWFDCGQVDKVIALKFPAFYLKHPRKKVWLMHQHRSVYELFDTDYGCRSSDPESVALREDIVRRDGAALREAAAVYTISKTVSERLARYNGIASTPLYQPPMLAEEFSTGEAFPYVFFPSRLETLKRQELLLRAMARVNQPVMAVFAGEGGQREALERLAASLGLGQRVRFLGRIDHASMVQYYKNALAVFFGPVQEDYGFITLEAMLSSKPVITCTDSGGPTEFVVHGETGFVVAPDPSEVADAINTLWADRKAASTMGNEGRKHYRSLNISWRHVVTTLLK